MAVVIAYNLGKSLKLDNYDTKHGSQVYIFNWALSY